jgi:hypothetical protein
LTLLICCRCQDISNPLLLKAGNLIEAIRASYRGRRFKPLKQNHPPLTLLAPGKLSCAVQIPLP